MPETRGRTSWLCGLPLLVAVFWPCAAQAESRWPDEKSAGVFRCHADFPLVGFASLLDEMARLQRDLVRTLGISEPQEPIHLFLFDEKSTYDRYLNAYFPAVPTRRALYIKERGPGMVFAFRGEEFEVDVRHEGTHALLHADLPMVPLWLDEGLAEYFEAPYKQRVFDHPHMAKLKWSSRIGWNVPKIERLEELRDLNQMGATEYRNAWAWVHFMLHGSSAAHDELTQFLADIRAHTPPGKLSDRLRRRIPNLEKSFTDHFREWKK